MPFGGWQTSQRRTQLPRNWPQIRNRILRRDGNRCTWINPITKLRCAKKATDVDHIERGNDHRDANLRSLCHDHHLAKSSSEGGQAAQANRQRRQRPAEKHPGMID